MLTQIGDFFRRIFRKSGRPYEPTIDPFRQLDLDAVRRLLRPDERGRRAGELELPPTTSGALDAAELEIRTFFAAEMATTVRIAEDRRKALTQSIVYGAGAGAVSEIERIRQAAVGDLRTLAIDGANKLDERVRRASELSRDLRHFREQQGLVRSAIRPSSILWHWGLLSLFVAVEAVVNGYMLARGNEFGLVGGAFEAVLFSLINVGILASFVGRVCVPQLYHRGLLRRSLGWMALAAGGMGALGFNLGVAHYRAAAESATSAMETATVAFETLTQHPFGLENLYDWLLFAVGVSFFVIAATDWFKMDDPYPGYGDASERAAAGRAEYAVAVGRVYDAAARVRDAASASLKNASRSNEISSLQRQLLEEKRHALASQLEQHRVYIESAFRTLIDEYRSANRSARTTPAPAYFAESERLGMVSVLDASSGPALADVETAAKEANAEIAEAYGAAVRAFETVQAIADKELRGGA
jgi:hypothetical protein